MNLMIDLTPFCNYTWYLIGGGKKIIVKWNVMVSGIIPMKEMLYQK